MAQKKIELILFRQFANYLAMPAFLTDLNGQLIFCNEATEERLGFRFSETGEMTAQQWSVIFALQDHGGNPIDTNQLPFTTTLQQKSMAHGQFYLRTLKHAVKQVKVTTIPLLTERDEFLAVMTFFQEIFL